MSYNTELQENNAELQSILNTINALPDAGGDGGSYDEGFADGKQSVIDNSDLESKTATGKSISVADVSEVAHDVIIQLSSDSLTDFSGVEITSEGENINIIGATTVTKSGVTLTVNGDGTITANGTASATVYMHTHKADGTGGIEIENGVTYYGLGGPKGGSIDTYFLAFQMKNGSTTKTTLRDFGEGVELPTDDTITKINPVITIIKGTVLNNAVFRPRIQYATNKDETFVSDTNGLLMVPSKHPKMTVVSNNADVNISATYYKSKGMQTEYERFWDVYQQNGNRTNYSYAFAGGSWSDENVKPKYPLQGTSSAALNVNYAFYYATSLTKTPRIISTAAVNWNGTFNNASKLKEIYIEGVIGKSISFQHQSQIDADSIERICSCLSPDVTGLTITFNSAAKTTFYNAHSSAFADADEAWTSLTSEHTNWTFVLS